jgi:hypothetical protein
MPVASVRSAAVVACWAFSPASLAAAPSASRPDRPAASRVGSTMPVRRLVPVVICCNRSVQVSCCVGQPRVAATGSGMATTTGLRATDSLLAGVNPGATELSRSSQVDESGTQTSGATAVPLACPTPARATPCCPASTAATSTESEATIWTATQVSPTDPPSSRHWSAASCIAGAISGAAATRSGNSPEHDDAISRW